LLKLAPGSFRFGPFVLDPHERTLTRDGEAVAVSGRYFDALALLVREHGRLVTKDRFLQEVWRGVPVTDEALTQCIRALRRELQDAAARPRFIETVPKYGYRFVASVRLAEQGAAIAQQRGGADWRGVWRLTGAGVLGGGASGLAGGLLYGFAAASAAEAGAASVLLVLLCLTLAMAVLGAAGVSMGIAAAALVPGDRRVLSVAGGAAGGLLIGAAVKLLGVDAFVLLFGRPPGDVAGAMEGAVLGGTVGLAAWLAHRSASPLRGLVAAGLAGALGGAAVPLLGGRLMVGSLQQLAGSFPESRLHLGQVSSLAGPAIGAVEGLLFAIGVGGAMALARRR
jgi:DNA-binding winged helix-turn-helix (wHTH) protein